MSSFGAVIPVTGLNNGFLGQISRTNSGEPCIVAREANAANVNNIFFGDTVVLLPDSVGGTYRQMKDFLVNGGAVAFGTVSTNSSTSLTAASTIAGLTPGMFIFGTGIPAGTYITAVSGTTITISQAATATATGVSIGVGVFAGIAGREVKTQLGYPYTPGASEIGYYAPGQIAEVMVGRGSVVVKINVGTPICNGAVYMRVALNGAIPAGLVGDLEAAPDGANTVVLPSIVFKTGVLDANNCAEITALTRICA